MPSGRYIETRSHIIGFREEIDRSVQSSKDAFFTWFNSAKDTDASFVGGAWDFAVNIASPIASYVSAPETKTALEIGYGGSRLLSAASRYFKQAIGVDVHDHNTLVYEELKKRGVENIQLHKTDGRTIPLADNSVDVVYSFIVLQHVEKIGILRGYFEESYRVLVPSGIALMYFGRQHFLSLDRQSKLLYWLDRARERVWPWRGYEELPSRVNEVNLRVSVHYAKRLSRRLGFQVLDTLVSRKTAKVEALPYGGQHGLLLRKG